MDFLKLPSQEEELLLHTSFFADQTLNLSKSSDFLF